MLNVSKKIFPPIKYFGGKGNMINKLLAYFPKESKYRIFVDAYGGGGTVLLSKPYKEIEIYNDLEKNVYSLYKVLQDKDLFQEFQSKAEIAIFQEAILDEFVQTNCLDNLSVLERAFQFWYINRLSRGGNGGITINASIRRKMSKSTSDFLSSVDRLEELHQRLSTVIILNRDALKLIKDWDKEGVFIYCDPPYLQETRGTARYLLDADYQHHECLVELLKSINHAKIALSGYRNSLYEQLEQNDYIRHDFTVKTVDTANNPKVKTESIWVNYNLEDV